MLGIVLQQRDVGKKNALVHLFATDPIDLTITSPPYKDEDGYSNLLMSRLAEGLYQIHRDNTLCFVNFGHLANFKERPFHVVTYFNLHGWRLQETFIWVKNHYRPIQGSRRVNNLFEYVFMFSKGDMPKLDRLRVGVPYKDKSNVGRFADKDLKCGGNVWYIPYETITDSNQKLHNDRFPVGLPLNCIDICGYPIYNVLDPFCGSGTTAIACLQRQERICNFVGLDINSEHIHNAINRVTLERLPFKRKNLAVSDPQEISIYSHKNKKPQLKGEPNE